MRKNIILIILLLSCVLLSSCTANKLGLTDKQISKYLSKIDGLSEIGTEDYDIPFKLERDDWVLCISPSYSIHTVASQINDRNMVYYSVSLSDLIRIRYPDGDQLFYDRYLHRLRKPINDRRREYLTNSTELPYFFQKIDSMNCSPIWHEWLDYNIPEFVSSYEEHGLFNIYWFDPADQKYEKGIYIREIENTTELYVVFHEMSLFYGTDHIAPYLLSEEMFENMKNEFGDSFNADGYAKGSVSEFSNWFMNEYLKEVPAVFANIEEDVYYPRYGGSLNYSIDDADEIVPEMISELKKIGVDFDLITSCVIKISVPHNAEYKDISWELID